MSLIKWKKEKNTKKVLSWRNSDTKELIVMKQDKDGWQIRGANSPVSKRYQTKGEALRVVKKYVYTH